MKQLPTPIPTDLLPQVPDMLIEKEDSNDTPNHPRQNIDFVRVSTYECAPIATLHSALVLYMCLAHSSHYDTSHLPLTLKYQTLLLSSHHEAPRHPPRHPRIFRYMLRARCGKSVPTHEQRKPRRRRHFDIFAGNCVTRTFQCRPWCTSRRDEAREGNKMPVLSVRRYRYCSFC
jgi:hypothetical protein